jgi:glycosyltransferase involved in cell wall biosynthesis
MRVLLCHQPVDGGVGRHICDLTEGLSARGHEVVLCSPAAPRQLEQAVEHVRLDLDRSISPRADRRALAEFLTIVRRVRPDIIHAHSSKAGAIARAAKVFSALPPVLYTPHGYAFAGYFSRPAERSVYRGVERLLAPLADGVVCVCEAEARLARSVGRASRIRVVHNGIAPAGEGQADPRIAELSRHGPVLGALTLLRPGKGLETLIAALPAVLASHPTVQLALVGGGPDAEQLRAMTTALGIAGSVHFLGASEDPIGALRGMDVFVHPSWAESFPYVILEAMSLARPIVASDVGGVGEAIVDGESGLLVPARDARRLGEALADLLAAPARARQLGESAYSRAGSKFTRTAMVDRTIAVYEEACDAGGPLGGGARRRRRRLLRRG